VSGEMITSSLEGCMAMIQNNKAANWVNAFKYPNKIRVLKLSNNIKSPGKNKRQQSQAKFSDLSVFL